jgi:predicted hotdog family 3-hydroxylacyl-ACP dehydratase
VLTRRQILELIPHKGTMCLLDEVVQWSASAITCLARSHLSPDNPLRRCGSLSGLCGIEYGLQAAALHGGLLGELPQAIGRLAALRSVRVLAARLDDPSLGTLEISAEMALRNRDGLIYGFMLRSAGGAALVTGRATIAMTA